MANSNDHAGDVYRFYDIFSEQIKISRDVQKSGKLYANGEHVSIPNYNQNIMIQITGNTCYIEEITEETENHPKETENENMITVRMTYDPKRDNMSEMV